MIFRDSTLADKIILLFMFAFILLPYLIIFIRIQLEETLIYYLIENHYSLYKFYRKYKYTPAKFWIPLTKKYWINKLQREAKTPEWIEKQRLKLKKQKLEKILSKKEK